MANDTTPQVGISLHGTGGIVYENIDTNKTLTLADNGVVQNVIADNTVITLPATTAGACFIIRNGGVPASSSVGSGTGSDFSAKVSISPNSADKIQGNGFTAADDKDAINTKATARVGDYMMLVGDGTDGWNVQQVKGTWAREA